MDKKRPLYVPIKTLDSEDYVAGIGNVEIAIIGISVGVSLVIGIILTYLLNVLFGIGAGILMVLLVFVIIRRDQNNENLIKKIKIIKQFNKSQKIYLYRYESDFSEVSEYE